MENFNNPKRFKDSKSGQSHQDGANNGEGSPLVPVLIGNLVDEMKTENSEKNKESIPAHVMDEEEATKDPTPETVPATLDKK